MKKWGRGGLIVPKFISLRATHMPLRDNAIPPYMTTHHDRRVVAVAVQEVAQAFDVVIKV